MEVMVRSGGCEVRLCSIISDRGRMAELLTDLIMPARRHLAHTKEVEEAILKKLTATDNVL